MTIFKQFLDYVKKGYIIPISDLTCVEEYKAPKEYQGTHRKLIKDNRSYQKNGYWYISPIGITHDRASVVIVCPLCGCIHYHGPANGHRGAHCAKNKWPEHKELEMDKGYYLINCEENELWNFMITKKT